MVRLGGGGLGEIGVGDYQQTADGRKNSTQWFLPSAVCC